MKDSFEIERVVPGEDAQVVGRKSKKRPTFRIFSVLSVGLAVLFSFFASPADAYRPNGWVWMDYPVMYSFEAGGYVYLSEERFVPVGNMNSGQWSFLGVESIRTGFAYFSWPWIWDNQAQVWYFIDEEAEVPVHTYWNEVWSRFGEPYTGDNIDNPSDYLAAPGSDPRLGNRTTRVILDRFLPPVDSQGGQGSCVGWGVGYYAKTAIEKKEEGWDVTRSRQNVFSPAFIYNLRPNRSTDGGMRVSDALSTLTNLGCARYPFMPYSQSDFRSQPSAQAFADGENFLAAGWSRIGSFGVLSESSIREMKDWLVSRETPVILSMDVHEGFQEFRGEDNGVIYGIDAGSYLGGHCMAIVGFDENVGGGSFRVVNSWGSFWGSDGFVWIPYTELRKVFKGAYTISDLPNGNAPSPAPVADNDVIEGAGTIQNGASLNGRVGPETGSVADVADWFKFTAAGGDRATIELAGLSADIDIKLTDRNEVTLKRSTNGGFLDEEIVYSFSNPGTYYVKVYPYGNSTESSYRLSLSISSAQNNDSPSSATRLDLGSGINGQVGASDPRDWFRVSVSGSERVRLSLTGMSEDLDLYLYDSPGDGFYLQRSWLGGSSNESITFTARESGGNYYVLVQPYRDAVSSYTLRASVAAQADLDAKRYNLTYWNYSDRVEMRVNELEIENVGRADSGGYRVGWGLSGSNVSGAPYYLGDKRWVDSNGTAAGGTSRWTNSSIATFYKSWAPRGNYFFVFHADVEGSVPETDESNNLIYSSDPLIFIP